MDVRTNSPLQGVGLFYTPHPKLTGLEKAITMDVDNKPAPLTPEDSTPGLSRRGFVKNTGKALYLAPTLTVLGAAPAAAQFGSPPPPPGGAAPPAPSAPAPNQ